MEEKRVCENCFGNKYIKDYIRGNGETNKKCDFCGSTQIFTISLETISKYIEKCLLIDHDKTEQIYSYESQLIGGLASLLHIEASTSILLETSCSRELAKLIAEKANLKYLTHHKHVSFLERFFSKDDSSSYDRFEFETKYSNRFFIKEEHLSFLNKIINTIQEKTITKIDPGTTFFRSRIGKFKKAEDLFPPMNPRKQNRMTPAGISAIYLANDENTSFLEIFNEDIKEEVSISLIKNIQCLTIADLTLLKDMPKSCFHPEYSLYKFLSYFIEQISKPIKNEDSSYEYVPTQIITEYIKTKIPQVNGIAYPSNRNPSGKNYVLFFNEYNCTTNQEKTEKNIYLLFSEPKIYHLTYSLGIKYAFNFDD